ncbi:glycosyltransferase [Pseudomonas alabamensis]|uniref:glycosyltransferase n=1 Tax=Pseudomonas alabamensis TaxID=3064349 RepID=UPI003F652B8C
MTHFAVVAPAYASHFQAFEVLSGALLDRGHRVTFFHQADAARWLQDRRIGFQPIGLDSHPPGTLDAQLRLAASPSTPWALHRLIHQLADTSRLFIEHLPAAFAAQHIEAVLCDQMEGAGGLVAEALGLPFVSLACALPVNREDGLPLPVMPFAPGQDPYSLRRCDASTQVYDWLMKPVDAALMQGARRLGVPPRRGLHAYLSPWLQLSQTPAALDFPRQSLPAHFHPVGPLRRATPDRPGAWPIDPNRPLVFASLGTLQGGRLRQFQRIARACRALDVQLLVAHCGGLDPAQEATLQRCGATWVTDFAPQRWILEQADAVVTHGGLNTVLDAIVAHTPMLVMPIAFDQHGVAARVAHHRLGLSLSRRASTRRIADALRQVLALPTQAHARQAEALAASGGAARAADLIEAALGVPASSPLETVDDL